MKKIKTILAESESKNLHLEHIEDEVFNLGTQGIKKSIDFLVKIRDMLAGHAKTAVDVSVKWDGAPSIVAGIDPKNGMFFVGTKSVFNKIPKINYTEHDIEVNHAGQDGLIAVLKLALQLLPELQIKGVVQGDILFTNADLQLNIICGKKVISFKPNVITYAVDSKSELGNRISNSELGLVFHTRYIGNDLATMRTSFNVGANEFSGSLKVWLADATFRDESGTASLTEKETEIATKMLEEINIRYKKANHSVINLIADNEQLRSLIKMYINSKIRLGSKISGTKEYVDGLVQFIGDRFQKEIDLLKTEKGKSSKTDKLQSVKNTISTHSSTLVEMFIISELLTELKGLLLGKLQTIKTIGTFIQTNTGGYRVTAPEGFVAIDRVSGHAVKLVDRLEFSKANFDLNRDWK